jgi:subtilisin family serine protease
MMRQRGRGRGSERLVGLVAGAALLAGCATAGMHDTGTATVNPWSYVGSSLPDFWWYDVVDVKGARAKKITGAGRTVAIVDTGVLVGHPALPPVKGVATCGANSADIGDRTGHGTELAGIALGQDPEGKVSTRGVAPAATFVAIKIDCGLVTADSLTRGIDAAIQTTPDVILLAVGGYPAGSPDVPSFLQKRVGDHPEILFVVASVWDGQTYVLPAWTRRPNVIVVAAMTLADDLKREVPFSRKLGDVWAPGRDVQTASIDPGYPPYYMQGTSAASAIVAGCAALVKQQRPDFQGAQLKSALTAAAEPKPDLGPSGTGRVNCNRAIP